MFGPWIMLADYAAWLEDGRDQRSFQDQVSRACVVPHLFTQADVRALDAEMEARGMRRTSSSHTYTSPGPWDQLKHGVTLISEAYSWEPKRGQRYCVGFLRSPDKGEQWLVRSAGRRILAQGTDREALWAFLDARQNMRKAA